MRERETDRQTDRQRDRAIEKEIDNHRYRKRRNDTYTN